MAHKQSDSCCVLGKENPRDLVTDPTTAVDGTHAQPEFTSPVTFPKRMSLTPGETSSRELVGRSNTPVPTSYHVNPVKGALTPTAPPLPTQSHPQTRNGERLDEEMGLVDENNNRIYNECNPPTYFSGGGCRPTQGSDEASAEGPVGSTVGANMSTVLHPRVDSSTVANHSHQACTRRHCRGGRGVCPKKHQGRRDWLRNTQYNLAFQSRTSTDPFQDSDCVTPKSADKLSVRHLQSPPNVGRGEKGGRSKDHAKPNPKIPRQPKAGRSNGPAAGGQGDVRRSGSYETVHVTRTVVDKRTLLPPRGPITTPGFNALGECTDNRTYAGALSHVTNDDQILDAGQIVLTESVRVRHTPAVEQSPAVPTGGEAPSVPVSFGPERPPRIYDHPTDQPKPPVRPLTSESYNHSVSRFNGDMSKRRKELKLVKEGKLDAVDVTPEPDIPIPPQFVPLYSIEREAKWYNRFRGKKPSKFSTANIVNTSKGQLGLHKADDHKSSRQTGEDEPLSSLVADDLLIYLMINKHVSYPNLGTKIEHMNKLGQKWLKDNDQDIEDSHTMHRYLHTIGVAAHETDTAFHLLPGCVEHSRYPKHGPSILSGVADFFRRATARCATRLQKIRLPRTPAGQAQLGSQTIVQGTTRLAQQQLGNITKLFTPN